MPVTVQRGRRQTRKKLLVNPKSKKNTRFIERCKRKCLEFDEEDKAALFRVFNMTDSTNFCTFLEKLLDEDPTYEDVKEVAFLFGIHNRTEEQYLAEIYENVNATSFHLLRDIIGGPNQKKIGKMLNPVATSIREKFYNDRHRTNLRRIVDKNRGITPRVRAGVESFVYRQLSPIMGVDYRLTL
jgi:hypothetical protein